MDKQTATHLSTLPCRIQFQSRWICVVDCIRSDSNVHILPINTMKSSALSAMSMLKFFKNFLNHLKKNVTICYCFYVFSKSKRDNNSQEAVKDKWLSYSTDIFMGYEKLITMPDIYL